MMPPSFVPKLSLLCIVSLSLLWGNAQNKPIEKLDKVTPKDFTVSSPVVDENANAVIIADIGNSDFVGNTNGGIDILFTETKRILLRNRNGFDAATVKVPIYMGETFDEEEELKNFEATTYNLENGQVHETKLDKSAVYKEKYNSNYTFRKFTFPDLKEGSIIEYKYTIKSPFWNYLRGWRFQNKYPTLWTQYKVILPPMFDYSYVRKGYIANTIDSSSKIFKSYSIVFPGDATQSSNINSYSGDAAIHIWAIKDVPAFKTEAFTSTSDNYLTQIDFHLHTIKYSENNYKKVSKNWFEITTDLLKRPDYQSLSESNGWMKEELEKTLQRSVTELEQAKDIYNYMRDNFACNGFETIHTSQTIKKTFQLKAGNVADINMLLIAMMKKAGMKAEPVILSTRENGKPLEAAPQLDEYNYLVARVVADSLTYILDASENTLGFGRITKKCLNGTGRLINNKTPILVPLCTDSIMESKSTAVFLYNDTIKGFSGTYSTDLGYYESSDLRKQLVKQKKQDYINAIIKSYSPDFYEVSNVNIDSLNLYDNPVGIQYDMKTKFGEDETVYFNPLLNEVLKSNPFVAAERLYPVEMPYKQDETYVLNMEIPAGYKVDEMPKSSKVKLNENEGMFEYIAINNGHDIQLRCRLLIKKATFLPEDYPTLRDFYAFVVKKEAEQIVFKKKK